MNQENPSDSHSIEIDEDAIGGRSRTQRRKHEQKKIDKLRKQNEAHKREAFQQRQQRKIELMSLSGAEKKAFLSQEKAQKRKQKEEARALAQQEKRQYAALPPAEKRAYKKVCKTQRRLEKRAKKSYVPLLIVKFTLIAAVLAGVVYAADVAYSTFVDNAAAFQDTQEALERPTQTAAPTATPAATQTPVPTPTPNPYDLLLGQADLEFMKNRVNILVLGIDESLERADWQTFRTDTMLLLSVDFNTNDVFLLSLPRDSYVWIYNKDVRDKINTAFSEGGGYKKNGFEYAMKTVSMALGGVPVNHYVCFDMNVVKEVVNAIGGLYYDVDVNVKMCGRTIEKGYQFLDGQKVLDYCRQRKGSSDVARVDRQQRMLLAIYDTIKSSGQLGDIPAIYSAVTGNIYTDLTLKQIASLSAFAMKVDLAGIQRYTLPGGFLNIDGTSFWGVDQKKTRSLVEDIFGVRIKIDEADDLSTLQALAQQKRQIVEAAQAALAAAQSYADANAPSITADEKAQFNSLAAALREAAAVKNTEDVAITIPPIQTALDAFNAWFANLQTAVETRKAQADAPAPPPTSPAEVPAA